MDFKTCGLTEAIEPEPGARHLCSIFSRTIFFNLFKPTDATPVTPIQKKIIFDVKNEKIFYNKKKKSVVKRVQIYLYTLKNDLFGCFKMEENETMTMKQV
jgi:mRNA-degrading endonuclease toxin of MazEF toxin-antitoxin module